MMNFKFSLLIKRGIIGCLLLFGVALMGCHVFEKSEDVTKNNWAIVDMTRLRKAHPDYNDWQRKQQQIAMIKKRIQAVSGQRDLAISLTDQVGGLAVLVDINQRQKYQLLFQERMAVKRSEVGASLQAKRDALLGEHEVEIQKFRQNQIAEYELAMVNLQMQIQALSLDDARREKLQQSYLGLNKQMDDELAREQNKYNNELQVQLKNWREKGEAELELYATQLNKELQQEMEALPNDNLQSMQKGVVKSGDTIAQLQVKLSELELAEQAIKNKIDVDLYKVIEQTAKKRGIDLVWGNVSVNVDCEDITGTVLADMLTNFSNR